MPLLENVRGSASSGETLSTVMAMGKKLGKKAVLAGNCFGFIGNRMIEGYCRESYFLLEEGCVPRDVDDFRSSFCGGPGGEAADEVAHVVVARRIGRRLALGKGLHHLAGAIPRKFGGSRPNCDE